MHMLSRFPRTLRSQAEVPNTARIYVDVGLGLRTVSLTLVSRLE